MRAREPFMFDGWRYMRFPLPPRSSDKKGNGKPDVPFELAGLVLQQYAKVLCVNQLMAPASATWRIGDIFCE